MSNTTTEPKPALTLADFEVGDHLIIVTRYKQNGEIVNDRRRAEVTIVNYNGNGLVTYGPRYVCDKELLESGQGAFNPADVGGKPFGLVAVEKTGKHSAPWRPWSPQPGNTAYDLMC